MLVGSKILLSMVWETFFLYFKDLSGMGESPSSHRPWELNVLHLFPVLYSPSNTTWILLPSIPLSSLLWKEGDLINACAYGCLSTFGKLDTERNVGLIFITILELTALYTWKGNISIVGGSTCGKQGLRYSYQKPGQFICYTVLKTVLLLKKGWPGFSKFAALVYRQCPADDQE